MHMMRADVRRLLPRQFDANGNPTGRRLVNDTDLLNNRNLQNNPYPLHTVTLPESGTGNRSQSAGASLVVVYRDPAEPLRKIVVYDGIAVIPGIPGATMTPQPSGGSTARPSPNRPSSRPSSAAASQAGRTACSSGLEAIG